MVSCTILAVDDEEGTLVIGDNFQMPRIGIVMQIGPTKNEVAQAAAKGGLEIGFGEGVFRLARGNDCALTKTARSQKSGTLPRLWVETSMMRPSSRKAFRSAMICSSVVTSTPLKGSSSRR